MPNAEVFEADSRDFENCFEDRKKDARKLARLIETAALENRQATYERVLANVRDPHGCRRYFVALGRRSAAGWPAQIALGMKSKLAAIVNGRPCAVRTGAAREKATSAWRRYKRLPAAIHAICDPPANLLKRLVRLLLVPAEQVGLGMGIGSDEPQNQETAGRGD